MEIASPCPTSFGRRNRMPDPKQMFEWLKIVSVRLEKSQAWGLDQLDLNIGGQITIGEFVERNRMPYGMIA